MNGVHQIDTFMRILPFIPLNGLNHHDTMNFYQQAMTAGLEYYMLALGIYSPPHGNQPILQIHPMDTDEPLF